MSGDSVKPVHVQPGDVETIAQLVLHERQGRDRGWWDRMRNQYWSDAVVHLS